MSAKQDTACAQTSVKVMFSVTCFKANQSAWTTLNIDTFLKIELIKEMQVKIT